jgi:hypothetical protein
LPELILLEVHLSALSEVIIDQITGRLTGVFFFLLGIALNTNRGGLSTSSSYLQRSQGSLSRYNTVEQSSSYTSNSRNNYATVDATRVHAQGEGLSRAYRNEKASFTVDTRDGGKN